MLQGASRTSSVWPGGRHPLSTGGAMQADPLHTPDTGSPGIESHVEVRDPGSRQPAGSLLNVSCAFWILPVSSSLSPHEGPPTSCKWATRASSAAVREPRLPGVTGRHMKTTTLGSWSPLLRAAVSRPPGPDQQCPGLVRGNSTRATRLTGEQAALTRPAAGSLAHR